MEKKNIDWTSLDFSYRATDKRYVAEYKDGSWGKGYLTNQSEIVINECAGVLQYAQTCFEGLKAYTTKDGRIVTFRPDLNAERMMNTCKRLCIPVVTKEMFLEAVDQVVAANAAYVPPFGTGATLYLRPYVFGSGPVIGVKASGEYQFRLFATPVGPYFKGGVKPVKLMLSDYDRAAPHGTGNIKAGLNYAMSLYPGTLAHSLGYADNMYLDSATRTYVEETGGANFLFVDKEGTIVIPKSPTILPSITRRSLVTVAKDMLGMKVVERPVAYTEVKDFVECGLCGTAAVISPVGQIHTKDGDINFASGMDEIGPVAKKLYDTLTGIQMGVIEGPEGWIRTIIK
ncbi:MAG: branched-chain amino acid aminotransferase [Spirochaetia bacterium]|jgi:branched-chain amino acid aminotransferase|nr:branched-chain amino acid aminotransferase [Spirochaetia bacterium]